MRETKNLKLTQFDPNDIPNWLKEYNSDMEKIDSEVGRQDVVNTGYETRFTNVEEKIQNNRNQINENVQDIANIKDDLRNIKGGSTVSIADLKEEVDGVEHSLTILKGDSDKTIDDIENDLAEHKSDITALGGRVETLEETTETLVDDVTELKGKDHDISSLETKVGTASTSNFGNDLSSAIGNTALTGKLHGKSVSEVLNFITTNSVHLEGKPEDTSGLSLSATMDYYPISKFFAIAIIDISAIIGAGGHTITAGTKSKVSFTLEGNKIPKPVVSHIYLADLYDFLPPENSSTASSSSLTLDIFTGGATIRTNVHNGNFIVSEKTISNYKIPVIIPCKPLDE